jgi:hypothetical protein
MEKKRICNFRLRDDVKRKLEVCARLMNKNSQTQVVERLIQNAYADALRCMPEKVKSIEAELEQASNGNIR